MGAIQIVQRAMAKLVADVSLPLVGTPIVLANKLVNHTRLEGRTSRPYDIRSRRAKTPGEGL